jgi:AcrR family transcriptional regulator
MTKPTSRSYGGQSQEARVSDRRERLMEAAARLYGREGAVGASVTAICAEAGLTPRYFYESFANREALLLAVFDETCKRLAAEVGEAVDRVDAIGSGLSAFFTQLADHPQLARVFLVEIDHHDPEMRVVGRALLDRLLQSFAPGVDGRRERARVAGAIFRVARIWIEGGAKESVEELVVLTRRFVDAGRAG